MKRSAGSLDSMQGKGLIDWNLSRCPSKGRKYVELRVAIGKSNRGNRKGAGSR